MGLNDEQEKLKQAREWLETLKPPDMRVTAAWDHVHWVLEFSEDSELRKEAQKLAATIALGRGKTQRGGAGKNGDGTWPPTDGRGCPLCGQIRGGCHGGGCPNTGRYDEKGNVIT